MHHETPYQLTILFQNFQDTKQRKRMYVVVSDSEIQNRHISSYIIIIFLVIKKKRVHNLLCIANQRINSVFEGETPFQISILYVFKSR